MMWIMNIIGRIFRVRENDTVIGTVALMIIVFSSVCALVLAACFMIFGDEPCLIGSIILLVLMIAEFCVCIDEMRQCVRVFGCVRKGKRYDGKIIGRTLYVKLNKNRSFEYAAKLIIEYSDGRIHKTNYLCKPQIDRFVSTECSVYIYRGTICADDFRTNLFRAKTKIELPVIEEWADSVN